jgi:hypothetical protein
LPEMPSGHRNRRAFRDRLPLGGDYFLPVLGCKPG